MSGDHGTESGGGYPRSWRWEEDGDRLAGRYVGTSEGPERFDFVPIVELELDSGEHVGLWLFAKALRSKFAQEVRRRPSADLEPGERIVVERGAELISKTSGYRYRDFSVTFERAAPARSAWEILGAGVDTSDFEPERAPSRRREAGPTDEIPF